MGQRDGVLADRFDGPYATSNFLWGFFRFRLIQNFFRGTFIINYFCIRYLCRA